MPQWCIGGGVELALCCDLRIAAKEAKFLAAGVNIGLIATAYRLPQVVGLGRAKQILLTGQSLDSDEAKTIGLISAHHPREKLGEAAVTLAKTIAQKAPLALQATKKIANRAFGWERNQGLTYQQNALEALAKTEDYQIALRAFIKKESPSFKGL